MSGALSYRKTGSHFCGKRSCLFFAARRWGLGPVAAKVANHAAPAFGATRLADVPAVQDQPVVRMATIRLRHQLVELGLYGGRVLAGGEAGAVGDPENMGVDRECLRSERAVHDDIGGLAAHARQLLERVAIGRNLAAMLLDESARQGDHVLRLGVEQADRPDVLPELFLA